MFTKKVGGCTAGESPGEWLPSASGRGEEALGSVFQSSSECAGEQCRHPKMLAGQCISCSASHRGISSVQSACQALANMKSGPSRQYGVNAYSITNTGCVACLVHPKQPYEVRAILPLL